MNSSMPDTGYRITPPLSQKVFHQHAVNIRKEADRDDEKGILYAAQYILQETLKTPVMLKEIDVPTAEAVVRQYVQHLLDNNHFEAGATILWGSNVYDWRPRSGRETWRCLFDNDQVMVMGAGAMGKSFSAGAWFYMDWWRDPAYTCIKVISLTKEHAERNIFANIKTFHRTALVRPLSDQGDKATSIQVNSDSKNGIQLVAIPKGESGHGTLRGYHPTPRYGQEHHLWGRLSRTHVVLDEAEEIPAGVWEGINNILSTSDSEKYAGHIKIFGASNPKDRTSAFGQRCEPKDGWGSVDCEDDFEWTSREGYKVLRLDAARCENVIEKRIVYAGLQTYQGFMGYMSRGRTAEAMCADELTEVLSERGWLKYNELLIGEKIYTINCQTGLAEWSVVDDIFINNYSGDMVSIENRFMSALVTPNHKWAVTNKQTQQTKKPLRLKLKETMDLALHDLIPLCRPQKEYGEENQYSEDLAELIGWVVTDGCFSRHNRVFVHQSYTANEPKCDRIKGLLDRLGHPYNERRKADGMASFDFSRELGSKIKTLIPNKRLHINYLLSLNDRERERLLEGLRLGDGGMQGAGKTGVGTSYVCTRDPEQADLYSILGNLCGYASRIHKRYIKARYGEGWMYYVDILQTKYVTVKNTTRKTISHNGIIWCPASKNKTFFARRNGKCYFTGNTMARGWFPEEGMAMGIITPSMMDNAIGTLRFIGPVVPLAAFDLALEGNDQVMCSFGRFGLSDGWTPQSGKFISFKAPRVTLQLDSQIPFPKKTTLEQAQAIINFCKVMKISPNWLCVDRTGNGAGIHDSLCSLYGSEVLGINYSWAASDTHILGDDSQRANELYNGVVTELIFGLSKYLEFGFLKISPSFRNEELTRQATSRRYKQKGVGLVRVESKGDYCKRTRSKSPDELDSLSMLVYLMRQRGGAVATMTEAKPEPRNRRSEIQSLVDKMEFVDMSD